MASAVATSLINVEEVFESLKMREGMSVADLGAGTTGNYVIPAAKLVGKAGTVYAVDIQKSVLDALRGRLDALGLLDNVKLVWGDIERAGGTRIGAALLDAVIVANNLCIAKDRSGLAREAGRILKSGGRLAVVDWKPSETPLGPAPESRVAKSEARQIFERMGFRFIYEFAPGDYHYGLIFEKP